MSALARAVRGAAVSLAPRERRWLRGHHETRGGGRSPGGARARLSLPRGWSPEATAAARAREVRVSPRPPGRVGRRAARRGSERRAGCQRRGAPRTRAEPRSPTATSSKFLSLGWGRTVLSIFRAQRRSVGAREAHTNQKGQRFHS